MVTSSVGSDKQSPDLINAARPNDYDPSTFHEYDFNAVLSAYLNEDDSYRSLTLACMSPLAAFLSGGSTLDTFGG